jgi:hypothetical protein
MPAAPRLPAITAEGRAAPVAPVVAPAAPPPPVSAAPAVAAPPRPAASGGLVDTLALARRPSSELTGLKLDRRGLEVHLAISQDLPPVLSDPARLETMLGGLMDRFSRGLPSGSQVLLSLQPAGQRLKLQLSSEAAGTPPGKGADDDGHSEQVGPVLSWNPDTGSLQLSRQATRQLFHQLGGRLTERGGSSLTVFFPLAERGG